MCEKCSHELRDHRFERGYRLTIAAPAEYGVTEVTPTAFVAMGKDPRIVACELCRGEHEVDVDFEGVIKCKVCTVYLKVDKLY